METEKVLLLHDPHSVWQIEAGEVDLFVAPRGETTDQPAGRWQHIFRFGQGQVLWGMPHVEQDDGLTSPVVLFCQALPGAKLQQTDRSTLLKAAAQDRADAVRTAALLENWLDALLAAVRVGILPRTWEPLANGKHVNYEPGQTLVPEMFVWVRHATGSSHWCGRKDWVADQHTGFVALPPRSWLTTAEDSRITVTSTEELLLQGSADDGIDATQRLLLQALAKDLLQRESEYKKRLAARIQHDRAMMEDALLRLANSITTGKGRMSPTTSSVVGIDDPLFRACQLVGETLGIEMIAPAALHDQSASRDPIMDIAFASRVQVRAVQLSGNWWENDNGPLLVFREQDDELHPLALLPLSPSTYEAVDPATDRRWRVTRENASEFHTRAFMFYPTFPSRVLNGFDLLRLGWRRIWWRDLLTVLLMSVLVGGLGTLIPIVTGDLFDRVIPQADVRQIWPIALLLVASAFGSLLFEFTRSIAVQRIQGRIETVLQAAVWDRVIYLPTSFFRQYSAGDLAVRAMGIDNIRQTLSGTVITTILSSLFSVFNYFLLFYYDRKLAWIATIILFATLIVTLIFGYLGVRYQRELAEIQGQISGLVLQLLDCITKFRMAGAEERAFHLWAREFSRQRRVAFQTRTIQNIQAVFHTMLPPLTSLVLFTSFIHSDTGSSVGSFLAFMAAFGAVNTALMTLSFTLISLLNVVPYYERSLPILQTLPEVDPTRDDPGPLSGEIELSHVWFRYDENSPWVIEDLSVHIRPGSFVAVVGPSGQGKSTLLRLLLGFEQPSSGAIYYDGKDLATLDLRALRRQIGVVLQHGTLSQGTIYSNIVGAANVSMDEVWEAARMAGLAEDIERFPMGMHTMIPDGGGTLSGGQRQRLQIARALVRKPRILFFDEATSALDNETQATVMQSLAKLQATRVVIAHRLSTIVHADRILVLNRGKIVQSGTYEELIAQEGLFNELARRQLA